MDSYQASRQQVWCELGGDCDNNSLNHNDFMVNSLRMTRISMEASSTWWDATVSKKNPKHITKNQWMKQQKSMYEGVWQFMEEQSVVVPIGDNMLLPVQMWYFSQQCYSAESYWTALSQDPSFMAVDSPIAYTSSTWASALCSSWEICN